MVHSTDYGGAIYVDDASHTTDTLIALRPLQAPNVSITPTPSIQYALDRFASSEMGRIWTYTSDSSTYCPRIGEYGCFRADVSGPRVFVRLGHVEETMGVQLAVGDWLSTMNARGMWDEVRLQENYERIRYVYSFLFCPMHQCTHSE